MSVIQPYITAFHRKSVGHQPDPAYVDFMGDFAADSDLVAQARAELANCEQIRSSRGGSISQDHETNARHTALKRMLEQFDNRRELNNAR